VATAEDAARRGLLGRGFILEWTTLGWNVAGIAVLAVAAITARSVALAGFGWTALTAAVMFTLAAGKARTGAALGNPVLQTEGRVTLVDGILATAVLAGLALNAGLGWWWADPAAGYILAYYAVREVRSILTAQDGPDGI
jgi:divalent metal cation (Fe/Co/Zn/Cd) transporter